MPAQIQAFGDTWIWTPATDQQYSGLMAGEVPSKVADALMAMRTLIGENDAMAYLVNMAPRLVELHRVLQRTGSLYPHCDPTMSHYLKILLDAIFGPEHFRNEIIWKRTTAHSSAKRYGPVHDVLLYYSKSADAIWTDVRLGYSDKYLDSKYRYNDGDGRIYRRSDLTAAGIRKGRSGVAWRGFDPNTKGTHWKYTVERLDQLDAEGRIYWPSKGGWPQYKRYLEEIKGLAMADVWTDIDAINSQAKERLGYPTQKPVALMERILGASSNEGDVILDPFCGCGTSVDAAIRLKRKWIGIDITYIAVDLIEKRLLHSYGPNIKSTYQVLGIPRDIGGAQALFKHSPFDFERWAVSLVNAQPNEKQVGDKGIDGVARFPTDSKGGVGRILVSVKGGRTVGPQFARDLLGTVETQGAQMGVLITMAEPTRGVLDAVSHGGTYVLPVNGQTFPKVQVVTVAQLLAGQRPTMPATLLPYIAATRKQVASAQLTLDED